MMQKTHLLNSPSNLRTQISNHQIVIKHELKKFPGKSEIFCFYANM